jgi:plasmid stability protein
MVRLDDGTPVHAGGRAAFDYMVELVRELQRLGTEAEARKALRAFIAVRSTYVPRYAAATEGRTITPEALTMAVRALVLEQSEGGRRAQAVAAGLFDVYAGPDRVESGRINDPSRKAPGDVNVRTMMDPERFAKSVEVRDKPVTAADVQIFGNKCVAMGVYEAAVLMVAETQPLLDISRLAGWAEDRGLGLTLFYGWTEFIDQALFWSERPKPIGATEAVAFIRARLVAVEASPAAVESWQRLIAR